MGKGLTIVVCIQIFLLYAVLDLLVDQHLDFLDEICDGLMLIKETLSEQPDRQLLKEAFRLIKQMITVTKAMPAIRSLVGELYDDYSE